MAQNVSIVYTLIDKMSKTSEKITKNLDKLEKNAANVDKQLLNLAKSEGNIDRAMKKTNKSIEENLELYDKSSRQLRDRINLLERERQKVHSLRKIQGMKTNEQIDGQLREAKAVKRSLSAYKDYNKIQQKSVEASKDINSITKKHVIASDDLNRSLAEQDKTLKSISSQSGKSFYKSQKDASEAVHEHIDNTDQLIASYDYMDARLKTLQDTTRSHGTAGKELNKVFVESRSKVSVLHSEMTGLRRSLVSYRGEIDKAIPRNKMLFNTFTKFAAGSGKIRNAMREVFDFSFFQSGMVAGLNFFETQYKILGILPLVAVAVGGLTSALGSLGAATFAVVGSLGRLAGGLAILPGLYAAIGVGALGAKNVMTGFITPAMTGSKQLEAMGSQIANAQDAVTKANKDVAKTVSSNKSFGEAAGLSQSAIGTNQKGKGAASAIEAQKTAQRQLNDLQKQQADILDKMPPKYKEIYDAVTKLKEAWKELWQGGKRGTTTADALIKVVKQLTKMAKRPEMIKIIEKYVELYQFIAQTIKEINTAFVRSQIAKIWIAAIHNLKIFINIVRGLGPYFNVFAQQVNWFTWHVLKNLNKNLGDASEKSKKFGVHFHKFLEKSLRSWSSWWKVIKNVAAAFGIISEKSGDLEKGTDFISRFEKGAVGVSKQFRKWAAHLKEADVRNYFEGSTKILKSMGHIIKAVVKAMGTLVSDPKAAKATARFFGKLATAIGRFAGFMKTAMGGGLADKMTNFLEDLMNSFSGKGGGMARAIGRVIDMLSLLVKAFNAMPPWVMEFFLTVNLGALALGYTIGALISPIVRLAGAFWKFGKGLKWLGGFLSDIGPDIAGLIKSGGGLKVILGRLSIVVGVLISMWDAWNSNFGGIRDSVKQTADMIKTRLHSALDNLSRAVGFKDIADSTEKVGNILNKYVIPALKIVDKTIGYVAIKALDVMAIFTTGAIATSVNVLAGFLSPIKDLVKDIVNLVKDPSLGRFGKVLWDVIKLTPQMFWNLFKALGVGMMTTIGNSFVSIFGDKIDWLIKKWNSSAGKIGKFHIDPVMGELTNALPDLGVAAASMIPSGPSGATVRTSQQTAMLRHRGLIHKPAKTVKHKADKTIATAQEAEFIPGYVGTEAAGAKLKWDTGSIGTFNKTIKDSTDKINGMKKSIVNLVKAAIMLPKNNLKSIEKSWVKMGDTIQKALHDSLVSMETELNNALAAMNAGSVSFAKGKGQTSKATAGGGTGKGGTGKGGTGDSMMGSGIGPGAGSMNWNGHPALNGSIVDYVSKGIANGLQVTSTTDHDKYTSSGTKSNHFLGIAADLSNGSAPTPQMDAYYASLVPYAKSGALKELIYKHTGWSNGQPYNYTGTDHFNHVHVAAGGAGAGLSMAQMSAAALTNPGILGKGALGGLATSIGQAAYNAATNLTSGTFDSAAGGEVGTSMSLGNRADANRKLGQTMAANKGWVGNEWPALDELWRRESGWIETAGSPGAAFGIPQSLPGNKMASAGKDWLTNPATQIKWGLDYIAGRYGDPMGALAFKNAHKGDMGNSDGWYGNGGSFIAKKPMMIGVGDKQPEQVTVSPTRGPNKGKHSGGKTTVINSSINLGTLIANEAGIEMLTEEIGKQIRKDVNTAQRHTAHRDD